MIKCPICKTASEQEKQEYCLVCAWEFEYFFSELSSEEKERYDKVIFGVQKKKIRFFLGMLILSMVMNFGEINHINVISFV